MEAHKAAARKYARVTASEDTAGVKRYHEIASIEADVLPLSGACAMSMHSVPKVISIQTRGRTKSIPEGGESLLESTAVFCPICAYFHFRNPTNV